MGGYYEDNLAGTKLLRCYEIASPRIREYLEAEIRFVVDRVRGASRVLELGCGYGRVLKRVAPFVSRMVGCDTSRPSLELARSYVEPRRNCELFRMNAACMAFRSGTFDAIFCIQNGISAFGVEKVGLIRDAARVTRDGGRILFSSYSPRIWEDRLAWFRAQVKAGLLGAIDEAKTGNGTIVCTDGFRATTVEADEFAQLFREAGLTPSLEEIDGSSLFCSAVKGADRPRATGRRPQPYVG